ncbi:LamG-like jellyroll fold domain-containing protein [Paenibacillus physcomitrellae]|uniref:F5/8 type C domain-containing protein n=1 Tax=Paenibacillus physcomitrellae TaxID=1619311 RepID=A0ABQ1FQC9_9BACL|nr:LamG-like jellyroll fold domain-containing protein [Paenibacillus physcomitrellae]GGA26458.1 hypothetical protein GCM10010917_09080 [Paenibacillus physcomitrellae]
MKKTGYLFLSMLMALTSLWNISASSGSAAYAAETAAVETAAAGTPGSTGTASSASASAGILDVKGTIYYVDSAAGSDANTGTSPDQAWKSLDKINATTFSPGDALLFKSGGVWNGQLWPKGSGTEGAPILIDRYGEGDLPVINGGGVERPYHQTGAIFLQNQEYWEIRHLEVTNDDDFDTDLVATTYKNGEPSNIRDGILVVLDTDKVPDGGNSVMHHIYISDCYIHDVDSPDEWPNEYKNASFNGGIMFYVIGSLKPNMTFDDVRIERNFIKHVDLLGIANFNYTTKTDFQDEVGGYGLWQTNIYIGHNYLQDIAQGGIDLCDAKDAVVEYNVLDGWMKRYNAQAAGIYPWKSWNVVFQNNEVYGGPTTTDATNGDGTAFDFDSPNINIVYQYNYTHDNPMGWMSYLGRSANNIARYNISDDDGEYLIKFGWFGPDSSPAYFLNNVFIYNGQKTAFTNRNDDIGAYFDQVPYYFYNNVFYDKTGPSPSTWAASPDDYGTGKFSHNVFYSANGFTATGLPEDPHKITADPGFVNPGQAPSAGPNGVLSGATVWDGYKLQESSPLVDAGIYVPQLGDKDFYGNPLYYGEAPDIGVQEVQQGDRVTPENPPEIVNLALGKKVTTDFTSTTPYAAGSITDGLPSTYWTSSTNKEQSITIDLGEESTFNSIKAEEYVTTPPETGNYRPFQPAVGTYSYDYWNGTDWVPFYEGYGIGASHTAVFEPVTANQIRMTLHQAANAPSLAEIAVYNDPEAIGDPAGIAPEQPEPAQVDVVAHYTFDNVRSNSSEVKDSSGSGLNATKSASVDIVNNDSYKGRALRFGNHGSAPDSYISIPDSEQLKRSSYTISMWVKPDDYGLSAPAANGAEVLYSKGDNANEMYSATLLTDAPAGGFQNPFILEGQDGTKGARWYPTTLGPNSDLTVPAGKWSQVVQSYDRHTYKIYINGELVMSVPVSKEGADLFANNKPLLLGNQSTGAEGKNPYYGLMDEVLILDGALTDQQVAQLYNGKLKFNH